MRMFNDMIPGNTLLHNKLAATTLISQSALALASRQNTGIAASTDAANL